MMQILAFLAIFFGEGVVIYAEELGAKLYDVPAAEFLPTFALTLIPIAIGLVLLVTGYMLGYRAFNNIWIVTVISFGSILLFEPLFNFFYIGEGPTLGAGIGFVLAILAILAALFIK